VLADLPFEVLDLLVELLLVSFVVALEVGVELFDSEGPLSELFLVVELDALEVVGLVLIPAHVRLAQHAERTLVRACLQFYCFLLGFAQFIETLGTQVRLSVL